MMSPKASTRQPRAEPAASRAGRRDDSPDPWGALGDPTRRTVFELVVAGPRSVTEIAAELPVSRPAVSQHLRVLAEAELVAVEPIGRRRVYRPRTDGLAALRLQLDRFWSGALSNFKQIAEQEVVP